MAEERSGRDLALDGLIASGFYREAFTPSGERVAIHIEIEALASGTAPGQIRGTVVTEAIRGHFRRKVGPCPCVCNSGGFCGGCGHAGCSSGINVR